MSAERKQSTDVVPSPSDEWDEGQAVSRIVRTYIEERDAALARLAAVRSLAERGERKGYDLDPYDVLNACNPPASRVEDDAAWEGEARAAIQAERGAK